MIEPIGTPSPPGPVPAGQKAAERRLRRRRRAERRFRLYGVAAIGVGLAALVVLLGTIVAEGYSAFWQTAIALDVTFSAEDIDPEGKRAPDDLRRGDYRAVVLSALRARFPEVRGRRDRRALGKLISSGAADTVRALVLANPSLIGTTLRVWVPASDDVDMLRKGRIRRDVPETARRIKDNQIRWLDALEARGLVRSRLNSGFLTGGDSREPELAGLWGAVVGSFLTMIVTALLAFPLGLATAVYLEEFAPRNRLTDVIEVNINNLAAVPSIVFGLLGLAVLLNFFGLPRSAPLVGGMVLALMTLPTVIIAARAALAAVPPSIREAAYGLGASRTQMVVQHVLPLAMPGIMTGTIIGMARALGETAPLLMIGMVAFIVDVPAGFEDPATVLPVQVFLWSDRPERAFVELTAAATIVLLLFLMIMNGAAVYLRKRFERRW